MVRQDQLQQPFKVELANAKQKRKTLKNEIKDLKSQHFTDIQRLTTEI